MNIKSFAHQIVYFCIGLLIIFFQILPLQTTPQTWSGPNVLLVFFAAIVFKRPEFTSSFLIASIFLIEDFFLMRPPGLMSSLTVIGFYILKRKFQNQEVNSFIFGWSSVTACNCKELAEADAWSRRHTRRAPGRRRAPPAARGSAPCRSRRPASAPVGSKWKVLSLSRPADRLPRGLSGA